MNDLESRNSRAAKQILLLLGYAVYIAGVVFGDVMYLGMIRHLFPEGTLFYWFSMIGGVTTAASAIVLLLAKTYLFAPGLQTWGAVTFWLVEIATLGLNTILSFQLGSGLQPADGSWLGLWAEFSPASPIIAVLGWGLVFMLDPAAKLRHAQLELDADLTDELAKQLRLAARAPAVKGGVEQGAQRIAEEYMQRLTGVPVVSLPPDPGMLGIEDDQGADEHPFLPG